MHVIFYSFIRSQKSQFSSNRSTIYSNSPPTPSWFTFKRESNQTEDETFYFFTTDYFYFEGETKDSSEESRLLKNDDGGTDAER